MSDETYTNNEGWASEPSATSGRVGFCQDCGKPLTAETVRAVGTGVFCEPCLATRIGTTGASAGAVPPYGAAAAPYEAVPPYGAGTPPTAAQPQTAVLGDASPVLAGFLGLIPGVGAMYNGQYAKGVMHLIIFAILQSLNDNVSHAFGLFVFGWVCYQVFDAYHTAKARVEGLPLPNAFGFNDIGERMGFTKNWPGANTTWSSVPVQPVPPAGAAAPPYAGPATPTGTDWVGYVPPTAFAGSAPVPPPVDPVGAHHSAPWGHAPYTETYSGGTQYAAVPIVPVPVVAARRFPVAAIWLIALGLLILIANLIPDWNLTGRWFPSILFAGLAVYIFVRRMRRGVRLVCILRAPAVLMALAILSALHAADLQVNFGLICAVLLIVIGSLLVLERTIGAGPVYAPTQPMGSSDTRASFTTAGPATVQEPATSEVAAEDHEKGGQ